MNLSMLYSMFGTWNVYLWRIWSITWTSGWSSATRWARLKMLMSVHNLNHSNSWWWVTWWCKALCASRGWSYLEPNLVWGQMYGAQSGEIQRYHSLDYKSVLHQNYVKSVFNIASNHSQYWNWFIVASISINAHVGMLTCSQWQCLYKDGYYDHHPTVAKTLNTRKRHDSPSSQL